MESLNFPQSFNSCAFYGQPEFISACNFAEISSESFLSYEDDEITSTSSSLNSASKKISKAAFGGDAKKSSKRARNPWTPKEDAKLADLMKKYGQSWAMISSCMEGRTGKQVRDRYLNKLRPNIKLGDWSAQEDELIVNLMKEVGNRWSLIANHLPGRTEGQVKNRYYSCIKKRLNPDGALSQTYESATGSESYSSFATTPVSEERFDFAHEYDFSMMVTKGPYVGEEMYSEQSTAQNSNTQSPFRVAMADPTDVISYEAADNFFFAAPIQHDSQIDEMLNGVTNYFQNTNDVDSFFADDLKQENFSAVDADAERFSELSRRKTYLELALAKTLKEIKGL